MRTQAKKEMQSMPDFPSVLAAGGTFAGSAGGIAVFDAGFPDDETSVKINGVGVNLSALNGKVPNGYEIKGHFTEITMPETTGMVLIVYR